MRKTLKNAKNVSYNSQRVVPHGVYRFPRVCNCVYDLFGEGPRNRMPRVYTNFINDISRRALNVKTRDSTTTPTSVLRRFSRVFESFHGTH